METMLSSFVHFFDVRFLVSSVCFSTDHHSIFHTMQLLDNSLYTHKRKSEKTSYYYWESSFDQKGLLKWHHNVRSAVLRKKKKDPHITWGRRKETARMVNLTGESKGNLFAGDVTSNVNQNLVTQSLWKICY